MTPVKKILFLSYVLLSVLPGVESKADDRAGTSGAEGALTEQFLRSGIEFLSDSICGGRGAGSAESVEAAFWISGQLKHSGTLPVGKNGYSHSFTCQNGATGRNFIGMIPGVETGTDRYILVISHYDNLGILQGNFYPGADSNASGVVSMLGISRMFKRMKDTGNTYMANIIFAALDGKNLSMAGAEALWKEINAGKLIDPITGKVITKDRIKIVTNLDIIGSTLEPLKSGREDFLIMLGGDKYRKVLSSANTRYGTDLELSFDYYGSKDFTNMFLNKIGDQKVFIDHGMTAVLFTSGITMETNKTSDIPQSINYPVLRRRSILVFHWIEDVIQELL